MKKHNMIYDPWIEVLDNQNKYRTMGIAEVLSEAHNIRSLASEVSTQDVAILRLLLGVLYANYTRYEVDGTKVDEYSDMRAVWKDLYSLGKFPEQVQKYLNEHKERFWLIHPDEPFWQVPKFGESDELLRLDGKTTLAPFKAPKYAKGVCIDNCLKTLTSSMGNTYFGLQRGSRDNMLIEEMSLADAARGLVYFNYFGTSMAGPAGATKVADYRQPYTAYLTHVTPRGSNLFETLMLNLVLDNNNKPWEDSCAWWERPHPHAKGKNPNDLENIILPEPEGITEYMTTQYRYLRLIPNEEGTKIVGLVNWAGKRYEGRIVSPKDAVDYERYKAVEQMAVWTKSKQSEVERVARTPATFPKQAWREVSSIILNNLDDREAPGVLLWLNRLAKVTKNIPQFVLSVDGVTYKNGSAKEYDYSDMVSVSADVLLRLNESWASRVSLEVTITNEKVQKYREYVDSLRIVQGLAAKPDNLAVTPDNYVEALYRELDLPFKLWLGQIDELNPDIDQHSKAWRDYVDKLIIKRAIELQEEMGINPFTEKVITVGKGEKIYTTASVYNTLSIGIYAVPKKYGGGSNE